MATVILVRHGRSTANTAGILAGHTSDVHLDGLGRQQVAATADRLATVPLTAVVSSPLERCVETAEEIVGKQKELKDVLSDASLTECHYGLWQGKHLGELAKESLWKIVVNEPSRARFPGGESLPEMQQRIVRAIRGRDAQIEAEHGPGAVWVAVSHGDPIKSVIADAYGMNFDNFQRVHVDPASVSIIHYGSSDPDEDGHRIHGAKPRVIAVNTTGGDLDWMAPKSTTAEESAPARASDPQVGGGAGH